MDLHILRFLLADSVTQLAGIAMQKPRLADDEMQRAKRGFVKMRAGSGRRPKDQAASKSDRAIRQRPDQPVRSDRLARLGRQEPPVQRARRDRRTQ